MLQALLLFSAVVISEAGAWDPAPFNAIPTHTDNPLLTPEEPTTLVLAIVGLGVIAVYAGASRYLRSGRSAKQVSQPRATTKRAA